jgi:hypothetical protein
LAPQLTDRAIGEPPYVPLTILSQPGQALGQARAHFLQITVRKFWIGPDKLP